MWPRPTVRADRRRAAVLAFIRTNPGVSFRGVCRGTGLASGTALHYVNAAERHGLVHSVALGRRRLLFPAGRVAANVPAHFALMDPDLVVLRDWLTTQQHRPCQKAVLDHAATAWSWSRSTTQHRLGRLVGAGLVKCGPQGTRSLAYEVTA